MQNLRKVGENSTEQSHSHTFISCIFFLIAGLLPEFDRGFESLVESQCVQDVELLVSLLEQRSGDSSDMWDGNVDKSSRDI